MVMIGKVVMMVVMLATGVLIILETLVLMIFVFFCISCTPAGGFPFAQRSPFSADPCIPAGGLPFAQASRFDAAATAWLAAVRHGVSSWPAFLVLS